MPRTARRCRCARKSLPSAIQPSSGLSSRTDAARAIATPPAFLGLQHLDGVHAPTARSHVRRSAASRGPGTPSPALAKRSEDAYGNARSWADAPCRETDDSHPAASRQPHARDDAGAHTRQCRRGQRVEARDRVP